MADEKKPSIYSDRTTIGSSNELDEYGVWVKSEAQVFSSLDDGPPDITDEFSEDPDSSDLSIPEMSIPNLDISEEIADEDNLPDDEDFSDILSIPDLEDEALEAGENSLDGFFQDEDIVESGAHEEKMEFAGDDAPVKLDDDEIFLDKEEFSETPFIDSDGDDLTLEDQSLPLDSSDILFKEGLDDSFSRETADLAIFENSLDSIEFEDDIPELSDEAKKEGFTEIAIEKFLDDTISSDISLEEDGEFLENGEIQDESLSNLSDINPEEQEEASMINSAAQEEKSGASDLSTQLLMRIADELSSIRSELSGLKEEFKFIREDYPLQDRPVQVHREDGQNKGFFDEEEDEKIALTGDELDNILNTAHFTEETGEDATEKMSDSFSFDDFNGSSINNESFSDNEPSTEIDMEQEPADGYPLSSQPDIITDQEEKKAAESFLDEDAGDIEISFDDDESIDLSGEDFLNETGTEQAENDEFDLENTENIIEEGQEKLEKFREEGVEPITGRPAPEEENFLISDPHAALDEEISFDDEEIDMSQAVIDEPDLSSEIVENPVEEPSLENLSLNLELEDEKAPDEISLDNISFEETPEEEQEEISLSIEGEFEADAFVSDMPVEYSVEEEDHAVPEGFVVDAEDTQIPPIAGGGETEAAAVSARKSDDDRAKGSSLPANLQQELKTVLSYMDQLLESLPDDKIEEFAQSEYFDTYKKLFKELGLT
ncbi:MAG: hypothetical protein LBQ88_20140 [Treponema sp.]|jgi:hypothetical protein|nr:hypothetical protein [Treponema sp.]